MELLSDVGGPVARVALQVSSATLANKGGELDAYAQMVTAFDNGVELTAIVGASDLGAAKIWLQSLDHQNTPEFVVVDQQQMDANHLWMRDAFVNGRRDGGQVYLQPRTVKLGGGQANWLAQVDGTPVVELPKIILEGGDCLVGDDFWLVGAKSVRTTAQEIPDYLSNEDLALAAIGKLDQRRLFKVGYRFADIQYKFLWLLEQMKLPVEFSIATTEMSWDEAVGRAAVLKGIPADIVANSLGDKLYQDWAHIDLVVSVTGRRVQQKPLLMVAELDVPRFGDGSMLGKADRLNALAIYLEGCGFAVTRNPTAYANPPGCPLWYNNVILQTGPDIVWVPNFDPSSAIDAANKAVWEGLGFAVRFVPGWRPFLGEGGALRCSTNITARR